MFLYLRNVPAFPSTDYTTHLYQLCQTHRLQRLYRCNIGVVRKLYVYLLTAHCKYNSVVADIIAPE